MLQLDLSISLNADSSGQSMREGLRICRDLVEELNRLVSERENTQHFWEKIMGNSGFIFDLFSWPENIMILSMMNPDHDLAFAVLSDEQRNAIQEAIIHMDIDLDRLNVLHCSESEYSEYQTALHETIEKFI